MSKNQIRNKYFREHVLFRFVLYIYIFKMKYACMDDTTKGNVNSKAKAIFLRFLLCLFRLIICAYLLCCKNIYFVAKQLYVYYPTFEDRVNSTARHIKIYYNEYELCELLFKAIYIKWNSQLTEEEKHKVYAGFYDKVIGRLVRFAAYSSEVTREKDIAHLKAFLLKPYVVEAGKYYKRKRETDSRIVPFLMKRKNIHLLWLVLRSKKNNYYKLYGKKRYAASLWKNDPLVEI